MRPSSLALAAALLACAALPVAAQPSPGPQPLPMPPEIAAYRQALRDLPQSDDWAPRVVWDPLKGVVVLGVGWPEAG